MIQSKQNPVKHILSYAYMHVLDIYAVLEVYLMSVRYILPMCYKSNVLMIVNELCTDYNVIIHINTYDFIL